MRVANWQWLWQGDLTWLLGASYMIWVYHQMHLDVPLVKGSWILTKCSRYICRKPWQAITNSSLPRTETLSINLSMGLSVHHSSAAMCPKWSWFRSLGDAWLDEHNWLSCCCGGDFNEKVCTSSLFVLEEIPYPVNSAESRIMEAVYYVRDVMWPSLVRQFRSTCFFEKLKSFATLPVWCIILDVSSNMKHPTFTKPRCCQDDDLSFRAMGQWTAGRGRLQW